MEILLIGLGLGVVGCAVMLAMLLFSFRRQQILLESIEINTSKTAGLKTLDEVRSEKGKPVHA